MTDGLKQLYERLDAEAEAYFWEQLLMQKTEDELPPLEVEVDDDLVSYRLVYTGDWA